MSSMKCARRHRRTRCQYRVAPWKSSPKASVTTWGMESSTSDRGPPGEGSRRFGDGVTRFDGKLSCCGVRSSPDVAPPSVPRREPPRPAGENLAAIFAFRVIPSPSPLLDMRRKLFSKVADVDLPAARSLSTSLPSSRKRSDHLRRNGVTFLGVWLWAFGAFPSPPTPTLVVPGAAAPKDEAECPAPVGDRDLGMIGGAAGPLRRRGSSLCPPDGDVVCGGGGRR
mmetsp:Transcript_2463/g.7209  ORF Transcript_2463/g.7209 Transcript_2463/m.7209 type:complete len:225 (-) Transcript_2463:2047-2721(-)